MRQHIDLTSRTLKTGLLTALTLLGLSGEHAQSDSTFFPEDTPEAATNSTTKETSDAIKEWAELKPTKKETAKLAPPEQDIPKTAERAQPQASTAEKPKGETPQAVSSAVATPDSKISPVSEEQKPLRIATPSSAPKASADTPEKQSLQLTTVAPHPKALPVAEKTQAPTASKNTAPKTVLAYLEAAKGRTPVGILEPTQEVHSQKWYIYSSAIRGLKNPSDSVHIVSMEGAAPKQGEAVKALLEDMGIEPEKVQLVYAKGEPNQAGKVYIFAGQ